MLFGSTLAGFVLIGATAAIAQIIGDPLGYVQIGTESSDHPRGVVAIANGGCASAGYVAVGNGGCRPAGWVAIGLGGVGATGDIVIADRGDAHTYDCGFICTPRVAVTGGDGYAGCGGVTMIAVNLGNGCAWGGTFAYTTNGDASSNTAAVAGSGRAKYGEVNASIFGDAGDGSYGSCTGFLSVTATGNSCGEGFWVTPHYVPYGLALSGTGAARGAVLGASGTGAAQGGLVGISGGSGSGGYAAGGATGPAYGGILGVSGAGTAQGGTAGASGTGDAAGAVAVSTGGRATSSFLAVGWGDSTTNGGVACVSATGNCGGGSVTNLCPDGRCS